MLRADKKFLLVPVGFMILRVWDIVISILFVYSQPRHIEKKHYKSLVYLDVSCACLCVCVCVFMCVFVNVGMLVHVHV